MKNLLLVVCVFFTLTTISCKVHPLKHITTDGLTYDGTDIYYNGKLCATLSAIEVAYDDGKIVKEATFVLTDSEYNPIALKIIKLVTKNRPDLEVEVELKN
jgi:hypothetical protein